MGDNRGVCRIHLLNLFAEFMLSNLPQILHRFSPRFSPRFLPRFSPRFSPRFLTQFRGVAIAACLSLLLSGCVKYDVGVTFDSQHSGQIVQTVRLGDRFAALNGASAQQWLDSLEARARGLKGKAKRVSRQELQVKIPFTTGKDFSQKFNAFFQGIDSNGETTDQTADQTADVSSQMTAALKLQQANFLLGVRSRLVLDVDLRSLGIVSDDETLVVNPGSLIDLDFRINGVAPVSRQQGPDAVAGQRVPGGMVWPLKPGQLNHIEARFWQPSALGLSTLALILVIAASLKLKGKYPHRDLTTTTPP